MTEALVCSSLMLLFCAEPPQGMLGMPKSDTQSSVKTLLHRKYTNPFLPQVYSRIQRLNPSLVRSCAKARCPIIKVLKEKKKKVQSHVMWAGQTQWAAMAGVRLFRLKPQLRFFTSTGLITTTGSFLARVGGGWAHWGASPTFRFVLLCKWSNMLISEFLFPP